MLFTGYLTSEVRVRDCPLQVPVWPLLLPLSQKYHRADPWEGWARLLGQAMGTPEAP